MKSVNRVLSIKNTSGKHSYEDKFNLSKVRITSRIIIWLAQHLTVFFSGSKLLEYTESRFCKYPQCISQKYSQIFSKFLCGKAGRQANITDGNDKHRIMLPKYLSWRNCNLHRKQAVYLSIVAVCLPILVHKTTRLGSRSANLSRGAFNVLQRNKI
jgi:hypothetical protein